MPDTQTEVELKFSADGVDAGAFMAFCLAHDPIRYVYAASPDVYWEQGESVVRHRHKFQGGAGELTVKKRRSTTTTTDRLEIDLVFGESVTKGDVEKFLGSTGWKVAFKLEKEARIFYFNEGRDGLVTVVLYDVKVDGRPTRRFLEIESEKGSTISVKNAKKIVQSWRRRISGEFKIGRALNESLYEIYSGRKYGLEV